MWSCLTEYDKEAEHEMLKQEFLEIGREEGLNEGRKMEAERMDRLVSELLKANRIEELKKATSDSEFKNKLFREFRL